MKVFGGLMLGLSKLVGDERRFLQHHVIMASPTQKRFLLATGLSADYISETSNDFELKVAHSKPGALFVKKDQRIFTDGEWLEVPESMWHPHWREAHTKRARSITRAQFLILKRVVLERYQPSPEKAQPLIDLNLVVRLPAGYVATDRGKLIVEHAKETALIDVADAENKAQRAIRQRELQAWKINREQTEDAKNAIIRVAREMLTQHATMDDLERVVNALERLENNGGRS